MRFSVPLKEVSGSVCVCVQKKKDTEAFETISVSDVQMGGRTALGWLLCVDFRFFDVVSLFIYFLPWDRHEINGGSQAVSFSFFFFSFRGIDRYS